MAIKPDLTFLILKLWRSSWTTTWFSAIHLPSIKANWQGEMILLVDFYTKQMNCRKSSSCRWAPPQFLWSKGLSFATSNLDMILYTTLQRLIGRKLFTNVRLAVFGIRTISELFASPGKFLCVKKDMTTFVTASPTRGVEGPTSTNPPVRNRLNRRSTGDSESTYSQSRIGKKTTRIIRFGSGFQNISPEEPELTELFIIKNK